MTHFADSVVGPTELDIRAESKTGTTRLKKKKKSKIKFDHTSNLRAALDFCVAAVADFIRPDSESTK